VRRFPFVCGNVRHYPTTLITIFLFSLDAPPDCTAGGAVPSMGHESAVEQIRALYPSASITYSKEFNRPPIQASADSLGVSLLIGGKEESAKIVRLGKTGNLLWQYDLAPRKFSSPFPSQLVGASNGSVMCSYGVVDEGVTRYLVFRADGSLALDDTLTTTSIHLSPDGEYYFPIDQIGDRIVLNRTAGGKRTLVLPTAKPHGADSPSLSVGFVDRDHAMVWQSGDGVSHVGMFDLRASPPSWVDLQFPANHFAMVSYPYQASYGHEGEFIYIDNFELTHLESRVFCFDVDGSPLWDREMKPGEAKWTAPRWVVSSLDQGLSVMLDANWLGIIETRTGRLLDAKTLSANLVWIYEASFENTRLVVAAQGSIRNRQCIITAEIHNDGTLAYLNEAEGLVRGAVAGMRSGVLLHQEGSESWLVSGFQR
jgi:hypothetical protein